jgi:hypothetical protein
MALVKWRKEVKEITEGYKCAEKGVGDRQDKLRKERQELYAEQDRHFARLLLESKLLPKVRLDFSASYLYGSFHLKAEEEMQKSKTAKDAYKQLVWFLKKVGDVQFLHGRNGNPRVANVIVRYIHCSNAKFVELLFHNIRYYKRFRKMCALKVSVSGVTAERRRKRDQLNQLDRIKKELNR